MLSFCEPVLTSEWGLLCSQVSPAAGESVWCPPCCTQRWTVSGIGRGGTSPLGDEKKFNPLKQPAICFFLLVPIYKRVQNNTTRMHENPPFWYQKSKKKFRPYLRWGGGHPLPTTYSPRRRSNSTPSASHPPPLKLNPGYAPVDSQCDKLLSTLVMGCSNIFWLQSLGKSSKGITIIFGDTHILW